MVGVQGCLLGYSSLLSPRFEYVASLAEGMYLRLSGSWPRLPGIWAHMSFLISDFAARFMSWIIFWHVRKGELVRLPILVLSGDNITNTCLEMLECLARAHQSMLLAGPRRAQHLYLAQSPWHECRNKARSNRCTMQRLSCPQVLTDSRNVLRRSVSKKALAPSQ